ncbi:MAG: cysteine--tRNA ligase, partial [Oscillospiraceae bacterium]|nr:cysteine--tRNA ligase [Oscillospiraceae bacterium]
RRTLRACGYKVRSVMNITDVGHLTDDADEGEDKMQVSAKAKGKTPYEVAEFYTDAFDRFCEALNVLPPDVVAKATGHIPEMVDFVRALEGKGYAYETPDGVYFDISRFPGYGRLSRVDLEEQQAGARVEVNANKRGPLDFALWIKAPKGHIMQWESPWGMGYPGWHIECSAMSRKYLGFPFDIHTGGVDHIPIHHENEIAQNEGLSGARSVGTWMHNEFLMIDGGKMSKSLGNVYTVDTLSERGMDPLAFRYFCLNAHYRSKLNFTWEAMGSADTALGRLYEGAEAHRRGEAAVGEGELAEHRGRFLEAISDDLNIPKALGGVWNIVRDERKSRDIYGLLLWFDEVLGLSIDGSRRAPDELPEEVAAIVARRRAARSAKDWAESDALRAELASMGYSAEDTPDGMKVRKARG